MNNRSIKMEIACNVYRIPQGWIIIAQTKDEDWIWHEHNEYDFIRNNEKLRLVESIKKALNSSNQSPYTNRNAQKQAYIVDLKFKSEKNFNKLAKLYRLTLKEDTIEIVQHKLYSLVNSSLGFTPDKSELFKFNLNHQEDFDKLIEGLWEMGNEISC